MNAATVLIAALAAELGVSAETITSFGLLAGFHVRRGRVTPEQAKAICAVHRDRTGRISQVALAAELGVASMPIARRARRLGIAPAGGFTPQDAEAIRRSIATTPRLRREP